MGGRLLPGDDGPVAQFMYHDAKGERITLCISHRKISSDTTAFKLYQDGSVNVSTGSTVISVTRFLEQLIARYCSNCPTTCTRN